MKIVVVSASGKTEEKEIEQVLKLFELGLETLHLRKPKFSTSELSDYISKIPKHFHNRIIIHTHHKLIFRFGLQGIHLTRIHKRRKFRVWFMLRRIKITKPNAEITTSFRKLASVYDEPPKYSYVFLSPIFDSLSGKYQSGFNEYSLAAALQKSKHKVIARGGMDITRIEQANKIGFYGIAFYSAIWKKEDPVAEFIKILGAFKSLGIKQE